MKRVMKRERHERDENASGEPSTSTRAAATPSSGMGEGTGEKGSNDERSEREEELEKDIRERDEFARRVVERGKLEGQKVTTTTEAAAAALEEIPMERLREISRREYLKKREEQQMELLREEIEDEEALFAGEELSLREKKELERKRKLFQLASMRVSRDDDDDDEGEVGGRYKVPEAYIDENKVTRDAAKQQALLKARYRDPDGKKRRLTSDQSRWEEQQIRKAGAGGSEGRVETIGDVGGRKYDLVYDTAELEEKVRGQRGGIALRTGVRDVKREKMELIREQRESLPMARYRDDLVAAVKTHQVVVVQSETGSGKTTQIPQYLVDEGFGRVCCTQPRRVAAMSVAARVAEEMGVKLGGEVGYSIRFEDCTSEGTVIKYMTDGMLLREFLSQPDLARYDVIMVDEAHERSVSTDIVMGLVKDIARFRGDAVRVIIASATLNAEKFSQYFDNAPVFTVPGRRFEVDIMYTKTAEPDYLEACVVTVLQIHGSQPKGDILVFLTGQDEIESVEERLRQRTRGMGSSVGELLIAPIYSTLPSELQAKIFEETPEGARKVVLATNIAETSVTIPGIVYVIDPGFCKQKSYSSKSAIESLLVVPISRAGAKQRAGRAGRMQAGKCFRLYTKWTYLNEMEEDTTPEILRTNLSQTVLLLLSLGIDNLVEFDFLDAPPAEALLKSLEHLYALGALNSRGQLTKLGRRMAELPLDPMMAKALLASERYGCSEEVATICAMLSVNNTIFYRPKEKKVMADAARARFSRGGGGDHMALLRCFNAWRDGSFSRQWCFENFVQVRTMRRARDVRDQLDALMERVELQRSSVGVADVPSVLKALTAGFFYHATRLQRNGAYRTVKNPHTVHIHPSSALSRTENPPRWIVYHELVLTSKEFMRQVFPIEGTWLHEVAPHVYDEKSVADTSNRKMPKMRKASMSQLGLAKNDAHNDERR